MRIIAKSVSTLLRLLFISAVLLASGIRPAQAQRRSIRFDVLSVDNGLSQSIVRAILQDSRGFMWFGTEDGLNRYDGYTFTVYKHDPQNPASIADSTIQVLFQDSKGYLWIGTSSGLDRLNPGQDTFQHFLSDPSDPSSLSGTGVTAIAEDQAGNLWVGSNDQGLNLYNRSSNTFTHFRHSDSQVNSLISNQITALQPDQRGGLWIGTSDGLDYYELQTKSFTHYRNDPKDNKSISSNLITSLCQDRFGILWIGTEDSGLIRHSAAAQGFTRYLPEPNDETSLNSSFIRTVYEDQNGQIWVGGRNGLNYYNRDTNNFQRFQSSPGDPYSLSNDYVLSIYADRTGVLWIGTYGGGINKYVQAYERFTLFEQQPSLARSLSNDIVNAIYEDRAGVIWLGILDGGLDRIDPETGSITSLQKNPDDPTSLGSNDVRAILEDKTGILWIGTYGGGLNRYDPRTGRFTRYIHIFNNPNSISDSRITCLHEDYAGNLWIGTYGGGLDRMDASRTSFTHFQNSSSNPESLSNDTVNAIYEDREGFLWIGTNDGISVLNPTTGIFTRYQSNPAVVNSLSGGHVLSFYEAPGGTMWVGTWMGGLNKFDRTSQKFTHYTQENGLPNNSILGILADSAGYLWMSTKWGISRFDPRTETFRNYDRRDGLQSNEFSLGAFFQNKQGWMYFGGVQGFNTFDPSRIQDNPLAPPVVITAFKKFNQNQVIDLTGAKPIRLSYTDNFISFEFAALDYSAPDKNLYAYKLEGFDKDWIDAGNRRYASYTNLRGGTYTFRVIGANPDGVWNDTGASVTIIVVPPIWERWWFIGSVLVILVGGAIGVYRLRIMNVQAQNRALETQVFERTQEIERRREVAEGLRESLGILNSNRTLKECLDAIILQILRLMETRGVIIFRCEDNCLPRVLASNLPVMTTAETSKAPVLPNWIIEPLSKGQSLAIPKLDEYKLSHPEATDGLFEQYKTLLAVPMLMNEAVGGGLILLYNFSQPIGDDDLQMAESFADHAALAIANAELRSQSEELAATAERSRLARDLHDAVTQTLFATSLIAEVLPRLWERNPEAGKQKITEIRELTRGALAEMRTLLMELRPTALEDVPLSDLLQQLSEAFTGRVRIPVHLDINKATLLPFPVKTGFYRITQEALNNIQKHSRAKQVSIQLQEQDGEICLCIKDNGVGFSPGRPLPDHFGLEIMEERAQNIGARFSLDSQVGKGTQILVRWKKAG